jgi:uncharacterized protein (TIGR03083 family)
MNATDILKYGHATFMRSFEGLPETDWDTPSVCGFWSVRNLVAHLASYEQTLSEVLTSFLGGGGGPTPYLDKMAADYAGFNDKEVEVRQGLSSQETLAEYEAAHARNLTLIAQIPVETLRQAGTIPWYGLEYAVDDYIVYAFYGHKREHGAQIAVFRDGIKR